MTPGRIPGTIPGRCLWRDPETPEEECREKPVTRIKHDGRTSTTSLVPVCSKHHAVHNQRNAARRMRKTTV